MGVRNGIIGKPTSYLNIEGPKLRYEERVNASKEKKLVAPSITESWVHKLEHNNVGSKGEISGGGISHQGGGGTLHIVYELMCLPNYLTCIGQQLF